MTGAVNGKGKKMKSSIRTSVDPSDHETGCRRYRAIRTPVECEHGVDVCPVCDPCTCKNVIDEETTPEDQYNYGLADRK